MLIKGELLNEGTENEMLIIGYELSRKKQMLAWLLEFITFGFLRLVFYWRSDIKLKCTHNKCELYKANKILLQDKYKQYFVEKIEALYNIDTNNLINIQQLNRIKELEDINNENNLLINNRSIKCFMNKKLKYIYINDKFERLKGLEEDYSFHYFQQHNGLDVNEYNFKRTIYGLNSIKVSITPLMKTLINEILTPFYVFQFFSCTLWFFELYFQFATCILVISAVSIAYSLYSIRRNERALRNMIHKENQVKVYRKLLNKANNKNNEYEEIIVNSSDLVPGDIIEIKNNMTMQCDALLIENSNVVVNESMLTGESIPITKLGIGKLTNHNKNDLLFNIKDNIKHVLFSGTQIIQTRCSSSNEKQKAIVLKTGNIILFR